MRYGRLHNLIPAVIGWFSPTVVGAFRYQLQATISWNTCIYHDKKQKVLSQRKKFVNTSWIVIFKYIWHAKLQSFKKVRWKTAGKIIESRRWKFGIIISCERIKKIMHCVAGRHQAREQNGNLQGRTKWQDSVACFLNLVKSLSVVK